MHTIEIDFDVYKALINKRENEDVTFNDVLRNLLGLDPTEKTKPIPGSTWVAKGVSFPNGTEFRADYKGEVYTGIVDNGALVVNGKRYKSPSPAAVSITGSAVNGWRFWECKKPGQHRWILIDKLREDKNPAV